MFQNQMALTPGPPADEVLEEVDRHGLVRREIGSYIGLKEDVDLPLGLGLACPFRGQDECLLVISAFFDLVHLLLST